MERMIMKKIKDIKGMFTPKNLPRVIILLIILVVLYFVYEKYLKESFEGFDTDSKNLEDQVKSGTKLVLFYADWCGHCKKIKPVWDETAKEVNEDEVKMIKVNCGEGSKEDQEIMKKYSIDGYPTIIKFVNGKASLYQGDRDADGFKEMFQ
jgi:protein disulfide-isomerase-like protein